MPIDFNSLSLWMLLAIFAAAALVVWFAGTRLVALVDGVATKTGLGQAFTGMLLLGGITSLPELAAVSTSAAVGNASLAVNNLLGTASINLVLLAVADIIYGRGALTSVVARSATLMQGVLSMLLAASVALIATAGEVSILGVGAGSSGLALACVAALWISSDFEHRHVWEVVSGDEQIRADRSGAGGGGSADSGDDALDDQSEDGGPHSWSLRKLVLAILFVAAIILAGGFFLSTSADVIATKTGLASGLVGFLLVGLSTSLPEISSVTAAVRLRRYDMAVGDIFGTNLFNIALIFVADVIYVGEPVLSLAGRFEMIGAILAIILTGVFVIGLIERRNRTILRMGYDSLASLLIFAGGLVMLLQVSD